MIQGKLPKGKQMSFFNRSANLPRHKSKEELDAHYEKMEQAGFTKKDMFAMVIAGFIAFAPILLVLFLTVVIMMLLFRAI